MVFSSLLDRLCDPVKKLDINSRKILIKDLEFMFMGMEKLLRDADVERSRRGTTDQHFERWVTKLQDLLYETDHMLDEWKIANSELKMEEFDGNGHVFGLWAKKVSLFIHSRCLCFKQDINPQNIVLETKELQRKIHGIIKEKKEFNFISSGSEGFEQRKTRYESFDSVDVSRIFGRDHDKQILVGRLLGEEGEDNGDMWTRTISIVGSGGLGKTALAQLVYNDDQMLKNFDFRVWVWVSNPFDMKMISKKIIKAAGGNSPPNEDILDVLLDRVLNSVSEKKFLIVLDDVWSEDYNEWVPLKTMLKGLPGSRILVTTRSKKVARMMGSCARDVHELDLLASDDCWSIISHQSKLSQRSSQDREVLEHIGRGIAVKCEGLPLIAMSMGSMLDSHETVEAWKSVLESPLWDSEAVKKDVSSILYLSYWDLSPVLKRCFTTCAVFQKNETIGREELLRIWFAHDCLNSKGSVEKEHRQGLWHFHDLANRSFFQDVRLNECNESDCFVTLHDMMHELASALSEGEHRLVMDGNLEQGHHSGDGAVEKARCFHARNVSQGQLTPLLKRLRRVRLLKLKDCGEVSEIPQEIGELTHLRYLQLINLWIRALPETLCDLYFLQTLDVAGCLELASLPQHIHKLVNLRHLLVHPSHVFHQGLAKLTGLWTLNCFTTGRQWAPLAYLKNLNQLRGGLQIYLCEMDEGDDAEEARMSDKIYIKEFEIIMIAEVRVDMVNALKAPPNVIRLRLGLYKHDQFPEWITSLNCLRVFELLNCFSAGLPLLGKLPSLEIISLCDMQNLECLGIDFLGIDAPSSARETVFPRLKKMSFKNCKNWTKCDDVGEEMRRQTLSIMPFLEEIELNNCPNLRMLPDYFLRGPSSLLYLTINRSKNLVEYYIKGDGRDMIAHVPNIMLDVQN